MSYEDKLNRLRQSLQEAQRLKSDAETKQSFYLEQQEGILKRIRELGVEPEELEGEINRLKEEMDRLLLETEELIPWELLQKYKR